MPELPEVETIARAIAPFVEGREVTLRRLDPRVGKLLCGRGSFARHLRGRTVAKVGRRGKALILALSPPGALVFRLGMTGDIRLAPAGGPHRGPHLHAVFALSGGPDLIYTDPRRFGRVLLDPSRPDPDLGLAPDPFSGDFDLSAIIRRAAGSRRPLKELLMDQSVVSGIGNIYASEILHRCRISPHRRASAVEAAEWRALLRTARRVLAEAVGAGGSTIRDFTGPDGEPGAYQQEHRVYGREGERCPRCRGGILRTVQGGRSTFHCPGCQR